ncbi:MAG: DUF167 family protein [Candidatus Thermoplasmatota archaeon]|nr:DUF167 family protein [Candidatus Thermoplasmatota archaeon]
MDEMKGIEKAIKETEGGVIIKLKVKTGSDKQKFPAGHDEWRECIVVETVAQPIHGKANKEIMDMARNFFGLKGDEVYIAYGHKSSEKGLFLNEKKEIVIKKLENEL